MRVLCPKCGSESIECVDTVITTTPCEAWEVDASGIPVPTDYGLSDVSWDSSVPFDPERPYQCGECGTALAPADLTIDPET